VKSKKKTSAPQEAKAARADSERENSGGDWLQRYEDLSWQKLVAWQKRPRLHTGIFEQALKSHLFTEHPESAFPSSEVKAAFLRERAEVLHGIEETKTRLGWDTARFDEFANLAVAFRKEPSIEHYLAIRKSFPDVDIQVGLSGGIDPLFAIEGKCRQLEIDPALVAGAMDGYEPDIDDLCLVLMDRIVARKKISGIGAAQKRRAAISDSMVNYLIAFMLDGVDWHNETIRLPASLILLIRHQLGPLKGDLHEEFESREAKLRAAWIAAQELEPGESLSINRLVRLASRPDKRLSRSTAARWLADKSFQKHFKSAQHIKHHPEKYKLTPMK
jgi:hypothetical protein